MRVLNDGKSSGEQHPMGEKQNEPFQLSFNALKLESQGSRVISNAVSFWCASWTNGFGDLIAEQFGARHGRVIDAAGREAQ
jgi:hypothetical protein